MAEAKRRLVTILAADVAGYSRLMGDDERATMDMLNACRGVFHEHISDHDGRVVDTAGDSVLAVFDSVVEAVQCGVELQAELGARNAALPTNRRMQFRIGINTGDIIAQDDGTVYGDGVNVAARLQALADPGRICVSETVRLHAKGKLEVAFEDLGAHSVKNISEPVRAYRATIIEELLANSSGPSLLDKPSIAVLPFDNLSNDPEQDYFADGISEDLITDLSKVSGLFVIARNSAFTYKGQAVKVSDVSAELGVRYILEGSVRKAGNRVRVTAQLIDGQTSGHIWADRYDRDLEDIFAVQDELTRTIVSALAVRLTADEEQRITRRGTDNLEAYDCFLKGREVLWILTREANQNARENLEKAIALDANYAASIAMLGFCHVIDYVDRYSGDPEASLAMALELAQRAIVVDDSEPLGYFVLSIVQKWCRDHDAALITANKTIALDPNFVHGYAERGIILHYAGRSEDAVPDLEVALRLDPAYPGLFLHFQAQCYFALGRYQQAEEVLKRRLHRNPHSDVSRVLLAATYGQLGRRQEARAMWDEALRINPQYSLAHKRRLLPYKNPAEFDHLVEGLHKAGLDLTEAPPVPD